MYKSSKFKRNQVAAKSAQPIFVSQTRNEEQTRNESAEKENTTDNNKAAAVDDFDEIFSSQDQDIPASQPSQSQSRFASQRHQVRLTEGKQQARGKNYFEIALISSKINVSDIGKFVTLRNFFFDRLLLACEFVNEGDDPVSFIRRFRSLLGATNNDNAKRFLEGFKEMFSLKDDGINVAQKYLTGLLMKEGHQRHQSQTSLIQCFFAVPSLRDEIAKTLLSTLKAYVIDR